MTYRHTFIDQIDKTDSCDGWGAAIAADFDGDGLDEFATGGKGRGFYFLYDYDVDTRAWHRYNITTELSPNVGAVAFDFDGDGRLEIVTGEWGDGLYLLKSRGSELANWHVHRIGSGLKDPHDIELYPSSAPGQGAAVVVREKDGRLMLFEPSDTSVLRPWSCVTIADSVRGDGTAVHALPGDRECSIITNQGIFRRRRPSWEREPLVPDHLEWHPETRIAVMASASSSGQPASIVITESEIQDARMAILSPDDNRKPWNPSVVISREERVSGLHSLQVIDLDGDGEPEVFSAEMENQRTDGTDRRPTWFYMKRREGVWTRSTMIDNNLGAHAARAGRFTGNHVEFAGKVWRPNRVNGSGGKYHVDLLTPLR